MVLGCPKSAPTLLPNSPFATPKHAKVVSREQNQTNFGGFWRITSAKPIFKMTSKYKTGPLILHGEHFPAETFGPSTTRWTGLRLCPQESIGAQGRDAHTPRTSTLPAALRQPPFSPPSAELFPIGLNGTYHSLNSGLSFYRLFYGAQNT